MAHKPLSSCSDRVVVAIDFGTTCTGYAYYFNTVNKDYIGAINTEQAWSASGKMGLQAPTTVLLTPEKKFHSFGFEAEEQYELLALDNEHHDWYYFRYFKMELHHQTDIQRNMLLFDNKNKSMEALEVFEHAIRYIRKHLLDLLKKAATTDIDKDQIRWVITVPAIWRESAKAFMREAATSAGIPAARLRLSLEPEAAAIYCKELASRHTAIKEGIPLQIFNPNNRYIILDLGGGTVDTTVHKVLEDGKLKELHAATGGAWGAQLVDEEFTDFIGRLVTDQVFLKFVKVHTKEWIDFCTMFETRKRAFTPETEKCMINSFPPSLGQIYEKEKKRQLSFDISRTFPKEEVRLAGSTLVLHKSIMMSFFEGAVSPICKHIDGLLKELKVEYLILIGGFSQSPVVRKEIETRFGKMVRIVAPGERSTAVLKGAVIYGIDPSIISSRMSPYTYGVNTRMLYNPRIHAKERKVTVNGRDIVIGAFDKHIEKGRDVFVGKANKPRKYTVIDQKDPIVFWKVYQSTQVNPIFCDEEDTSYEGRLKLNIPAQLLNKKLSLSVWMECKGTELVAYAEATDQDNTKNSVKCSCELDFLGDPVDVSSDFTESIN